MSIRLVQYVVKKCAIWSGPNNHNDCWMLTQWGYWNDEVGYVMTDYSNPSMSGARIAQDKVVILLQEGVKWRIAAQALND